MTKEEYRRLKGQVNGLTCIICGKPLTGIQRCYCSSECRRKSFNKTQKPKAETQPKPKISKAAKEKRFQKSVKEAKARGLSYGQLKALEYIENNRNFTQ